MLPSWIVAARSGRYSQTAIFVCIFSHIYFDKKHVFLACFSSALSKEIVVGERSNLLLCYHLPVSSHYFHFISRIPSYFLYAWDSEEVFGIFKCLHPLGCSHRNWVLCQKCSGPKLKHERTKYFGKKKKSKVFLMAIRKMEKILLALNNVSTISLTFLIY